MYCDLIKTNLDVQMSEFVLKLRVCRHFIRRIQRKRLDVDGGDWLYTPCSIQSSVAHRVYFIHHL